MSICHTRGPKLQLKSSEDLMHLFKCGLFCFKWSINIFLFLKTIQWSEFFLTILCVWFIQFCQKFCEHFSVSNYQSSPKGWVNVLEQIPDPATRPLRRVPLVPVIRREEGGWWQLSCDTRSPCGMLTVIPHPPLKKRGKGQRLVTTQVTKVFLLLVW